MLRFHHCQAEEKGGGLSVVAGHIKQSNGFLEFKDCGGPLLEENFILFLKGGALALENGNLTLKEADVRVQGCTARDGGGFFLGNSHLLQDGGRLHVGYCEASDSGGGILMHGGRFSLTGGTTEFTNCDAKGRPVRPVDEQDVLSQSFVPTKDDEHEEEEEERKETGEDEDEEQHQAHQTKHKLPGSSFLKVGKKDPFAFEERLDGLGLGGGLWVKDGAVDQRGGNLSFWNCSSYRGGGLALSGGKIQQHGGFMSFHHCIAEMEGAGMNAERSDMFFTGNLNFTSCRVTPSTFLGKGGAMALLHANLTLEQAEVQVDNCSAETGGGFSILNSSLLQSGGQFQLHHCSASLQGGGFFFKSGYFVVGGTILVDTCIATSGGGIFGKDSTQFHVYGMLAFTKCQQAGKPSGFGGGLEVHQSFLVQSGGTVSFNGCESEGAGGAAYVHESQWKQDAGALNVTNCTAHAGGGFAFSGSQLEQLRGEIGFSGCSSQSSGGALDFSSNASLKQVGGTMQIQNCVAKGYGGCISMTEASSFHAFDANGTMRFLNCSARTRPALYLETNHTSMSTVVISDATAEDRSDLISVFTSATLDVIKVDVQNVWQKNFAMSAAAITMHNPLDCRTASQNCLLYGQSVWVPKILCYSGTGLVRMQDELDGCSVCDPHYMQLTNSATVACTPCPEEGIKRCEPALLETQKGFMVEVLNSTTNDFKVHHCLNPSACPGGSLPYSAIMPMCAPGYMGKACLFCEVTHATSDADVLSCEECATNFWTQTIQVFLVIKDVLIFLIAYRGGLGAVDSAGKQKDAKTSSILLNQFMAFGSVASIALLAALNTESARILQNKIGAEIWVPFRHIAGFSGEFSPGAAGGGISTQCLASYMGLPRSAWMAHILSSIIPLILVFLFAIANDVALACIVGSNCFLPTFCANFSKYFVYFRTRKESKIMFKDLPEFMTPFSGFLCFGFMILLCFGVAITTWTRAALSKNPKVPPHVAYLRRPYKDGCAMMEVERLSRKMILKTFSAALPIIVYPIFQLTMVITVMLVPLCLRTHLKPYKKLWLNKSEVFLIIAGVIMACLANVITASDQHWATRTETQERLLLMLFLIAAVASSTLGILILRFMYAEFRGDAYANELDEVM